MIDRSIVYIAEFIASNINSTTILKYALISLIVSLPLGFWLGVEVIIAVLVFNNVLWLVTEYLYARAAENPS